MTPRLLRALSAPRARAALVLGLAFATLFGTGSRDGAGLTGDPVRYACVAREIVESGDPLRLTLDGEPYANKPPLVLWAQAAAMAATGFTEWAARLPSRLFGLATVALLLGLLASRHGRRAAFFGALALATWHTFQRSAATARVDSALAFFTLAGLAALLRADRRGPTFRRALAVGALFGLGVLSKGVAGLLGPAAAVLGSLGAGRGRLLGRLAPGAALAFLVVSVPWYALQVARDGSVWWEHVRFDLAREHAGGAAWKAVEIYGGALLLAVPWIVPAVLGVAAAARRVVARRERSYADALLLAVLVVLAAGIVTRDAHYARYLVPGVPALAWFAGTWLAGALRPPVFRRVAAAGLAVAVLIAYPTIVALDLWPTRAKHGALFAAVRAAREERPDAASIPAWPWPFPNGYRAATCFYTGVRLRPFDPRDASAPRLLVVFGDKPGPSDLPGMRLVEPPIAVDESDRLSVYRLRPEAGP